MTLECYLKKKFASNKPIFLNEIRFSNRSKNWLYIEIKKLCESGALLKHSKGIYYLPEQSKLGGYKQLNPFDIAEKKYIKSGKNVYGYYSGLGLANYVCITEMNAATACISTNKTSKQKIITIGSTRFIIKKAYAKVTAKNIETMRFLSTVTDMPEQFVTNAEKLSQIESFFSSKGITASSISELIGSFPPLTSKRLIESGLIFSRIVSR